MKVCSTGKPVNFLFLSPLMPLVGVLSGGCRGTDARIESRGWDFRAANWSGLRSPVQNRTMFSLKEGLTSNTAANTQEGINNHFWPVCNTRLSLSFLHLWCDLTHSKDVYDSPSASSAPNTSARDADTPIQCNSESRRRLKLISAASTPTLARPSQSATWSGRLSMKMATTSPEVQPWLSAQWATELEIWSNWAKVHVLPVASYTSAGLSGCLATVFAKMEGMLSPLRTWRHSASLTLKSTFRPLTDERGRKLLFTQAELTPAHRITLDLI